MSRKRKPGIASPTIAEVFVAFLDEQERPVSRATFSQYDSVVRLLTASLNGYAYDGLDAEEAEFFDRLYSARGDEHREFCEVFGPEHILPNLDEFLGYFMVRKVWASKQLLRAAGTVTRKLARWLADKEYVDAVSAREARELGAEAARSLPEAEDLGDALRDLAARLPPGEPPEQREDYFTIARVEGDRIWLSSLHRGDEVGPVVLPPELAARCPEGWSISGLVGHFGGTWAFLDVGNVYPL